MVLHEKVCIGREVCVNSTRYVRWQYNSSEVCGRSDGGLRGEGGAASRIGFEPLFVCNGAPYCSQLSASLIITSGK